MRSLNDFYGYKSKKLLFDDKRNDGEMREYLTIELLMRYVMIIDNQMPTEDICKYI